MDLLICCLGDMGLSGSIQTATHRRVLLLLSPIKFHVTPSVCHLLSAVPNSPRSNLSGSVSPRIKFPSSAKERPFSTGQAEGGLTGVSTVPVNMKVHFLFSQLSVTPSLETCGHSFEKLRPHIHLSLPLPVAGLHFYFCWSRKLKSHAFLWFILGFQIVDAASCPLCLPCPLKSCT